MEFTFKVDDDKYTSDWATYRQFIESLRRELANSYSHNRPVLPPQQNSLLSWFHVVLQTESHEITLRIRRDNLYLDAYRMENSDQWLQFGRGSGPDFLGFDGDYNDLENAAGQTVDGINLGQLQLVTAVNQLATTNNYQERAKQLIVVIQMICESIRFSRISDHLASQFRSGSPPPPWMIALEHGWGNLSAALLRADADPTHYFRLPQPNDMQIGTAEDAVAALGILLFFDFGKPRFPRMLSLAGEDGDMLLRQGRSMVEVFWVRIDDIDGEDPGQLYGTITVADGLGSQYIYDRQSNNYETISPGDKILLTGPTRAISAYDSFTMKLYLFDKDTLSPDDEVSNGIITWNVFDTANFVDNILYGDVKGKYGSARVCYTVLSDAVEATVAVYLINGDGEDPADVYGEIAASYSSYWGEQTVLFRKKKEEYIEVRPGQLIALTKKTIAVPSDYSLSVRAELYDHDTISPDDEIANGAAAFPPLFDGTSEKNITGKYGNILVRLLGISLGVTSCEYYYTRRLIMLYGNSARNIIYAYAV